MLHFLMALKTNLVVIPLIRLAYKLKLFIVKRALKVRLLLSQEVRLRIRYLEPDARLEGYDDKFDLLVNLTSIRLLNPEIFHGEPPEFLFKDLSEDVRKLYSDHKHEYVKNQSEVDSLAEKLEKDEDVAKSIVSYNLVRNFVASHLEKKDEADYYLSKALKLNPGSSVLTNDDLFALERSVRKDISQLRNEIADRQAIKISLSLERGGALISVISCFFLISGYLYNHFFLGSLGVEVSKYFTLSDYLASSIEAIRYSATGASIAIVSYFWGAHRASRKSYAQIEYERKRREYWPYVILLSAIVGVIGGYIKNSEAFYDASYILIIFATFYFAPLLAARYFKEPLTALFVLVFIAAYSAHMFASAGKAIYRARYHPFEEIRQYEFKFRADLPLTESQMALLAGNSRYVFFLDHERNTYVIPRDQILYFFKRNASKER